MSLMSLNNVYSIGVMRSNSFENWIYFESRCCKLYVGLHIMPCISNLFDRQAVFVPTNFVCLIHTEEHLAVTKSIIYNDRLKVIVFYKEHKLIDFKYVICLL